MDLREQLSKCNTSDVPIFSLAGTRTIGKIVEAYDGDTVKIVMPLTITGGSGGSGEILAQPKFPLKFSCRLYGVDTPEMKPKAGSPNREQEIDAAHRSRNFLLRLSTNCPEVDISRHLTKTECSELLRKNTKIITIVCGEFDKYGRLLVELYDENAPPDAPSYNQRLFTEGYAKAYFGGTKEAFDGGAAGAED